MRHSPLHVPDCAIANALSPLLWPPSPPPQRHTRNGYLSLAHSFLWLRPETRAMWSRVVRGCAQAIVCALVVVADLRIILNADQPTSRLQDCAANSLCTPRRTTRLFYDA